MTSSKLILLPRLKVTAAVGFAVAVAVLLALGTTGCGKSETPATAVIPTVEAVRPQVKSCVDLEVGKVVAKQREAQVADDSGAFIQAMKTSFESAVASCGMNAREREQYLAYTNVTLGVMPDSVGDDALKVGVRVIHVQNQTTGLLRELFTNGYGVVRFDGQTYDTTLATNLLAPRVEARKGIRARARVLGTRNRSRGYASEVFANGFATLRWEGSEWLSTQPVGDLAPALRCLGLCVSDRVISNSTRSRGYLREVFVNSIGFVQWDGDSYVTPVALADISGLAK